MSQSPILSIKNAAIGFAKKVLFENLNLHIFANDKICLIGKNGVGKSTLIKAIAGKIDLDCGEYFISPNVKIGYLSQNEKIENRTTVKEFLMIDLKIDDHKTYLIDIICENLNLDLNALTNNLSGGQVRRLNLARALIVEPEILLLDEPTNHLDLEIIKWLENYLISYKGAIVVISHDRKFLEKITNKVFWIRVGQIKINPHGYRDFDNWSQNIIDQERRELANLEKKFELESSWLQTGVTARRKRNIGRLHFLEELKNKLSEQRKLVKANQNNVKINSEKFSDDAPQVIMSFNNVSKEFSGKKIIDKFSLKILRGERIGIIGKNGSGKSTLLKMIVDQISPDSGNIKRAKDISLSYFDQFRLKIKPNLSIQEIMCESGGDYINLANDKTIHICGYLKQFLFEPDDRFTLASTLSGGQQNRLLLAKTLANPGNFMILDEPTNDLDVDTLDMLTDYLEKYQGTLIVVSHDRDFLDNVVTSILAFEENNQINSYLGGYSDYVDYLEKRDLNKINSAKNHNIKTANSENFAEKTAEKFLSNSAKNSTEKVIFTNKMKFELEKLPAKIQQLEKKITELSEELSNCEERNSANLAQISIEIAKNQKLLDEAENRWLELENIKESTL
jgi:ATP-binding cassette subfamily F protein uup